MQRGSRSGSFSIISRAVPQHRGRLDESTGRTRLETDKEKGPSDEGWALRGLKSAAKKEAAQVNANAPHVVQQPMGRDTVVVIGVVVTEQVALPVQVSLHPPAIFCFAWDWHTSRRLHVATP